MTAFKDYMMAALLIAVNIINTSCDENDNKGFKREASISGFSSFPQFDSFNFPRDKIVMGKTTVEYWPPDMDIKKFYNLKKDPVMELWPKDMSEEMRIKINEPIILTATDSLPDIPVNIEEENPPKEEKFEAMLKPTETSLLEEMAITNRSPVIFPTSEPTTRSPDREVAYVSRGGNKKRKLKKKVKPVVAEVPFVEVNNPNDSAVEVLPNGERPKVPQVTPIYEYIDEPVVNIFQPIRYTDVISNLSNLTAQTFGSNNKNSSNVVDDSSTMKNSLVVEDSKVMEATNGSKSDALEINLNVDNNLSSIDIMLDQLKLAIEERDLAKIRNIVQSMDEDEEKLKKSKDEDVKSEEKVIIETTTEAMTPPSSTITVMDIVTKARSRILNNKARISSDFTSETPTTISAKIYVAPKLRTSTEVPTTDIPETTKASKIYLAPKVRAAQKKLKQVKIKPLSSEKVIESSSASVTEIPMTVPTKLELTTEKRIMSTVAAALNARPTKRKRSHITSRSRHNARAATRNAQRNISGRRSSGRKP